MREGCGLVLIQPLDAEVSPLVPSTPIALPKDPDSPVRLGNGDESPWKRAGAHYVTRAIPVEAFPFEFLESYPYKAAPGAESIDSNHRWSSRRGHQHRGEGKGDRVRLSQQRHQLAYAV